MKSIIVILPYFGRLPEMFPFWLASCQLNSTVDFLVVTDQKIEGTTPNVRVVMSSLAEVKHRLEQRLGMDVWLERAYKLCDLKPLYGDIFREYVDGYDFWGYCDCDLVFGDIRRFLTDELLERYDYLLGLGHFHVQRVADEKFEGVWKSARGLWRNIGWQDVFRSSSNEWFDELPYGVSGRYYEMYPDRFWSGYDEQRRCFESPVPEIPFFMDYYNNYSLYKTYGGYQDHLDRLPFWVRKEGGDLTNKVFEKDGEGLWVIGMDEKGKVVRKPILYAHFMKRNMRFNTRNLTCYLVRPNCFVDCRTVTRAKLVCWNIIPKISYQTSACIAFVKKNLRRFCGK